MAFKDAYGITPPREPITLAFAATGIRPTAVLTSPRHLMETGPGPAQPDLATGTGTSGMVPVRIERHPLAATAGLVWSGDLSRRLQQVLFDTAVGITF